MEVLFKQSFNYAHIQVYKNYSDRLARRIEKPVEPADPYHDPFMEEIKDFIVEPRLKPPLQRD